MRKSGSVLFMTEPSDRYDRSSFAGLDRSDWTGLAASGAMSDLPGLGILRGEPSER